MNIFVAGATGALGRQLVPMLVARGHEVTAMSRSGAAPAPGVRAVAADGLDRDAVIAAVVKARPEVVVHEMTALTGLADLRRFERAFAPTNRLRTEGTDNLLAGAHAAGARRLVAQSYAGWPYARVGGPVKTEDDPLDADPPKQVRTTIAAIRHLEEAVLDAADIEGVVLRYGGFYGPGTSLAPEGGEHLEAVRQRKFPIIGSGAGVWSFVHIADAAAATVAAIEGGAPGVYNIVDDDPAPVRDWLPALAAAVGAQPPRHIPAWLGRLVAGGHVVTMMTELRGCSNAKAKRELGWTPRVASWRDGFRSLTASESDAPPRSAARDIRARAA
jgi:nucleoside-diphosphate-sugar epimerase